MPVHNLGKMDLSRDWLNTAYSTQQQHSQDTKDRFRSALRRHGERRHSPLAWLRMEPAGAAPDLRITTWRNGSIDEEDLALATSSYHGVGTRRM